MVGWIKNISSLMPLTIDDFIEDLKDTSRTRLERRWGGLGITAKTERAIRQAADQIFGNLKRSGTDSHKTKTYQW
jgi:hypothetical protein